MGMKDFYSPELLAATAEKPPGLPKGHRFYIPGFDDRLGPMERAIGRAIMEQSGQGEQKVRVLLDGRFNRDKPMITGYELVDNIGGVTQALVEHEIRKCMLDEEARMYQGFADVIRGIWPDRAVEPGQLRAILEASAQSYSKLTKLRQKLRKYRWRDAAVPPKDSRRVVIWTNRGEYIAHYDHKWKCWRTTRDGLKITHWREQCGPENWPAAE